VRCYHRMVVCATGGCGDVAVSWLHSGMLPRRSWPASRTARLWTVGALASSSTSFFAATLRFQRIISHSCLRLSSAQSTVLIQRIGHMSPSRPWTSSKRSSCVWSVGLQVVLEWRWRSVFHPCGGLLPRGMAGCGPETPSHMCTDASPPVRACRNRRSPRERLSHSHCTLVVSALCRWLASEDAEHTDLAVMKKKLKSFNARRKLRAGLQTVRTAVRMKMLLAGVKRAAAEQRGQEESKTAASS